MTQVRGYVGRLFATALLLAVGATGVMAESPPPDTSSFRSEVDTLAASVKVQTERVVAGAHRALERSTQKLVVFKARMRSGIETWRAALGDEKADVMTLSQDVATTLKCVEDGCRSISGPNMRLGDLRAGAYRSLDAPAVGDACKG